MILRVSLISLLLLGVVGFLGVAWVSLATPPQQQVQVAPVQRSTMLVAARPLRAGTLLRPEDIAAIEVPVTDLAAGARTDSTAARAELIGKMVRRGVGAGTPLTDEDLLRPGDRGFLAVLLAPGMRAASIGVDAVTGIAGLVWPGDRVDVVLTQQLNDDALPVGRRVAAETVLRDARVIAIDQAIVQGAMGDGPEAGRQVRTVTLEVAPVQAERLAVAARLGRLSLTVRAADEGNQPAPFVATWGGDVSQALRSELPASTPARTVNLHLGSRREEIRF